MTAPATSRSSDDSYWRQKPSTYLQDMFDAAGGLPSPTQFSSSPKRSCSEADLLDDLRHTLLSPSPHPPPAEKVRLPAPSPTASRSGLTWLLLSSSEPALLRDFIGMRWRKSHEPQPARLVDTTRFPTARVSGPGCRSFDPFAIGVASWRLSPSSPGQGAQYDRSTLPQAFCRHLSQLLWVVS